MEDQVSRRRALSILIGGLTAAWAAAAAGLSGLFVSSTVRLGRSAKEVLLGDLSIYGKDFRPVRLRVRVDDGWYKRVQQQTVYIRENREDPDHPVVLSATCSHLGCTVKWNADENEFQCPCHGGRFAEDGSVLGGPPPTGLTRLAVELRDGDVYVRVS